MFIKLLVFFDIMMQLPINCILMGYFMFESQINYMWLKKNSKWVKFYILLLFILYIVLVFWIQNNCKLFFLHLYTTYICTMQSSIVIHWKYSLCTFGSPKKGGKCVGTFCKAWTIVYVLGMRTIYSNGGEMFWTSSWLIWLYIHPTFWLKLKI
jgi:hypothetical protein